MTAGIKLTKEDLDRTFEIYYNANENTAHLGRILKISTVAASWRMQKYEPDYIEWKKKHNLPDILKEMKIPQQTKLSIIKMDKTIDVSDVNILAQDVFYIALKRIGDILSDPDELIRTKLDPVKLVDALAPYVMKKDGDTPKQVSYNQYVTNILEKIDETQKYLDQRNKQDAGSTD